jgi:hypothetical protein
VAAQEPLRTGTWSVLVVGKMATGVGVLTFTLYSIGWWASAGISTAAFAGGVYLINTPGHLRLAIRPVLRRLHEWLHPAGFPRSVNINCLRDR